MADKNFEIWQLKEGAPDTPQMLFTNFDYMTKHGFLINTGIYDCVYAGMTAVETTPEDIYVRFNINHPEDYWAHSRACRMWSCSRRTGKQALFIDSIGYTELPRVL